MLDGEIGKFYLGELDFELRPVECKIFLDNRFIPYAKKVHTILYYAQIC